MPPLAHVISGLIWAALGRLGAAITVTWLLALFSLVTTGAVFGWIHGHDAQQSFDALQQNPGPAWHQLLLAWQTLIHGAR